MSSVSGLSNLSSLYSNLFSKLDTKGLGYLELSDLESAYSAISNSSTKSSSSASDVFSALDGNSDGKVTESEFTSTLSGLESQFQQMRMQGMGGHGPHGMGGHMPPPPQNDTGFTKAELQSQLDQSNDSDSQRTSFISNVVNNFEAADTNGDGKVSFQEAASYNSQSSNSSTDGSASSSTTDSTSATSQLLSSLMTGMNGMGGMPPPPPQNDAGFSKDELENQLSSISSTDSQRASLISNIVNNFSAADTDGNGKVTHQEAKAFEQTNQSSSSSTGNSANAESAVLQKIMQLMQAYGEQQGRSSSLISATA